MKLIRSFIYSAGAILLAAALERFLIATGTAQHVLSRLDPILGIPLRYAVLIVGILELIVAVICLFGRRVGTQIGWLVWLSTNFTAFWVGLIWEHGQPQGACLGALTDPLNLSGGTMGLVLDFLPVYLVLGSFAALFWVWFSKEAKASRLVAAQLRADQHDVVEDLLKTQCPSCGGKIKFSAQNIGRQILCPHCQAAVTLRKPEENLKISCYFCNGHIAFLPHAVGQKLKCPHCHNDITLKEPATTYD
jgi:phage FluMu protein Com